LIIVVFKVHSFWSKLVSIIKIITNTHTPISIIKSCFHIVIEYTTSTIITSFTIISNAIAFIEHDMVTITIINISFIITFITNRYFNKTFIMFDFIIDF